MVEMAVFVIAMVHQDLLYDEQQLEPRRHLPLRSAHLLHAEPLLAACHPESNSKLTREKGGHGKESIKCCLQILRPNSSALFKPLQSAPLSSGPEKKLNRSPLGLFPCKTICSFFICSGISGLQFISSHLIQKYDTASIYLCTALCTSRQDLQAQ